MKNARRITMDKAGAPGTGAAIVTLPGDSASDLVTVERGQPVTTTERVAVAGGAA